MRRLTFFLPLLWMPGLAHADELPAVAQRFVAAFQAMHQASSTAADVDRLLALCTDELVYEHARVGAWSAARARSARASSPTWERSAATGRRWSVPRRDPGSSRSRCSGPSR